MEGLVLPWTWTGGGGGAWGRGWEGLDGSLTMGAVVASAETHTVLLLVEHVGRFVEHDHGTVGVAAGGAGHAGEDDRGLHSVVKFS